jgi:predicted transcriptional regulator
MRRDSTIPALGSLEAKIMQALWGGPDEYLSVRATMGLLDGDPAYTTVMTVMNRLYEKGLLRRQREGRAFCYRPAMSREAYAASTMSDALRVATDRRAALLHFIADLNSDEAASLRRLLDQG